MKLICRECRPQKSSPSMGRGTIEDGGGAEKSKFLILCDVTAAGPRPGPTLWRQVCCASATYLYRSTVFRRQMRHQSGTTGCRLYDIISSQLKNTFTSAKSIVAAHLMWYNVC